MNHRERVISAVKHLSTDRPPFDFRAETTAMERIYSFVNHWDNERLLKDLDVDIRHIDAIVPKEKKFGDYYQNYWGERYI